MNHVANVEKAIVAQLGNPHSPLVRRVTECNQIWLHNYAVEALKVCHCELPGCHLPFEITLIPNQVVYPKYCEVHRTEYRRELHLQKQKPTFSHAEQEPQHSILYSSS